MATISSSKVANFSARDETDSIEVNLLDFSFSTTSYEPASHDELSASMRTSSLPPPASTPALIPREPHHEYSSTNLHLNPSQDNSISHPRELLKGAIGLDHAASYESSNPKSASIIPPEDSHKSYSLSPDDELNQSPSYDSLTRRVNKYLSTSTNEDFGKPILRPNDLSKIGHTTNSSVPSAGCSPVVKQRPVAGLTNRRFARRSQFVDQINQVAPVEPTIRVTNSNANKLPSAAESVVSTPKGMTPFIQSAGSDGSMSSVSSMGMESAHPRAERRNPGPDGEDNLEFSALMTRYSNQLTSTKMNGTENNDDPPKLKWNDSKGSFEEIRVVSPEKQNLSQYVSRNGDGGSGFDTVTQTEKKRTEGAGIFHTEKPGVKEQTKSRLLENSFDNREDLPRVHQSVKGSRTNDSEANPLNEENIVTRITPKEENSLYSTGTYGSEYSTEGSISYGYADSEYSSSEFSESDEVEKVSKEVNFAEAKKSPNQKKIKPRSASPPPPMISKKQILVDPTILPSSRRELLKRSPQPVSESASDTDSKRGSQAVSGLICDQSKDSKSDKQAPNADALHIPSPTFNNHDSGNVLSSPPLFLSGSDLSKDLMSEAPTQEGATLNIGKVTLNTEVPLRLPSPVPGETDNDSGSGQSKSSFYYNGANDALPKKKQPDVKPFTSIDDSPPNAPTSALTDLISRYSFNFNDKETEVSPTNSPLPTTTIPSPTQPRQGHLILAPSHNNSSLEIVEVVSSSSLSYSSNASMENLSPRTANKRYVAKQAEETKLRQFMLSDMVNPTSGVAAAALLKNSDCTEVVNQTHFTQLVDPEIWLKRLSSKKNNMEVSTSLITHEISRGDWTWATCWNPDGTLLAIGSENHYLAVIDTRTTVWRIVLDSRQKDRSSNDTPYSIRSIAWNEKYLAVGGIGDAVCILDGKNFEKLHMIKGTGFVGSLNWKCDEDVLAIGSREDQCLLVRVHPDGINGGTKHTQLTSIERTEWVNRVAFSPGGTMIALGDRSGRVSVYVYLQMNEKVTLQLIVDFLLEASCLSLEWSADGSWLYAGGEEFLFTIIDTTSWKIINAEKTNRWVQFANSQNFGDCVAVGGGEGDITILESGSWKKRMNIPFSGKIVLDAQWHPKDYYMSMCGQDGNIRVVETTTMRAIKGAYGRFDSGVTSVDFSPDGKVVVVGRDDGVVSFLDTTEGQYFMLVYEALICVEGGGAAIARWSPDGNMVAVGGGDSVVIFGANGQDQMNKGGLRSRCRFMIKHIIKGVKGVKDIAFSPNSETVVLTGLSMQIIDTTTFVVVQDFKRSMMNCAAWSPDGTLLAVTGIHQMISIFSADTSNKWKMTMQIKCHSEGLSLSWGSSKDGKQHLACSDTKKNVTIVEISPEKGNWKKMLEIKRQANVVAMDWKSDGMLAMAQMNDTTCVCDLSHLKQGNDNESIIEIRRKENNNIMTSLRWLGGSASAGSVLALGGTDGVVELMDLTNRRSLERVLQRRSKKENGKQTYWKSIHERLISIID